MKTFTEISVGNSAEEVTVISEAQVVAFAKVSGDHNPVHLDPDYAAKTHFGQRIVHGALLGALISGLISKEFPTGSVVMSLTLHFSRPVYIGSTVSTRFEVAEINPHRRIVKVYCEIRVDPKRVVRGETLVCVPKEEWSDWSI